MERKLAVATCPAAPNSGYARAEPCGGRCCTRGASDAAADLAAERSTSTELQRGADRQFDAKALRGTDAHDAEVTRTGRQVSDDLADLVAQLKQITDRSPQRVMAPQIVPVLFMRVAYCESDDMQRYRLIASPEEAATFDARLKTAKSELRRLCPTRGGHQNRRPLGNGDLKRSMISASTGSRVAASAAIDPGTSRTIQLP